MSQNSVVRTFFNTRSAAGSHSPQARQHALFRRMEETINTVLKGVAACTVDTVGTHEYRDQFLPVVRFSLPNGASLTICDHGQKYGRRAVLSVRSPQMRVPADMIRLIDADGPVPDEYKAVMPDDSRLATYARDQRRFTVLSWEQQNFGRFAAQFAQLQKASLIVLQPRQPLHRVPVQLPLALTA